MNCFSGTKLFEYYNIIYEDVSYHVLWCVLVGQNYLNIITLFTNMFTITYYDVF